MTGQSFFGASCV